MGRRQLLIFITALCVLSCTSEIEEQPSDQKSQSSSVMLTTLDCYPEFSWDYVNTYAHLCKMGSNFTEEQAEVLARMYNFISLEGGQGDKDNIGSDIERHTAAVMIKKFNPKCKVLAYRSINSDSSWSMGTCLENEEYAYMELMSDDGTAEGESTGKMDHRYETYVEYWKNCVYNVLDMGGLDGIYCDSFGNYEDAYADEGKIGAQGSYDRQQAVFGMLDDIIEHYDNTKIIMGNGVKSNTITNLDSVVVMDHASGGFIDHFANYTSADAETIAADIEVMRYLVRNKKMCVVKGWTRYDSLTLPNGMSQAEQEAVAREDIVFPLACFLMGAGEYCYFCYSWYWLYDDGGMIDYDEYSKPLGESLGDYVADGWNYYREFEHAKVWANLETHNATIEWDVDNY